MSYRATNRHAHFESAEGSGATLLPYRRGKLDLHFQNLNLPDYVVEPPMK